MTKSTITRERLAKIAAGRVDARRCNDDEIAMAITLLAAMDSEPVAFLTERKPGVKGYGPARRIVDAKQYNPLSEEYWSAGARENHCVTPLYRHAQQPVVPDDVLEALQKVARIRLDLNDFDGDRRGIADCLGDAEEALIEVVNRRAAMLNGGKP
ncbi:TPA: hypothetical protein MAH22_004500 [Klebsiella quasipneumoniae subsp. quasipneumoniae]|nr:hypothetical protein [Klebsiella quasipneumoniae subsp. quasipneumoniae]